MRINNDKITIITACALFAVLCQCSADTNIVPLVREKLDAMYSAEPRIDMRYEILSENICFNTFHRKPAYETLANTVSNDWAGTLANLGSIATNNVERLLVVGVATHYDEEFYIDFIDTLCDMRTNGTVTVMELESSMASHRIDLMTCFIRRYQEPRVRSVVEKLLVAEPSLSNHWQKILSGQAYTNYLQEVEAGLWQ